MCRRLLVALVPVRVFVAVRQTFVLGCQGAHLRVSEPVLGGCFQERSAGGLKRGLSTSRLSRLPGFHGLFSRNQHRVKASMAASRVASKPWVWSRPSWKLE